MDSRIPLTAQDMDLLALALEHAIDGWDKTDWVFQSQLKILAEKMFGACHRCGNALHPRQEPSWATTLLVNSARRPTIHPHCLTELQVEQEARQSQPPTEITP